MAAARRAARSRRWVAVLAAVLLLVGGGLVVMGLTPGTPEAAPLPAPFSVASSVAPLPSASATPSSAMAANMLSIPSLGIDAPLLTGSITSGSEGRTLEIPNDPAELTRYDKGAGVCASAGTVLVAGHVAYGGRHGALWPLAGIAPNALVYMTCGDATVTVWQAVAVEISLQEDLPQDIFTATGPLRAEIITCGGPVTASGHYSHNVRVELVRVK